MDDKTKSVDELINDLYNRIEKDFYKIIKYNDIDNNVSFQRDESNISKKIQKEFIEENKINKEKLNKDIEIKYKKYILLFFKTLEMELSHCNFSILNKNIENLQIKKYKLLDKLKNLDTVAYYLVKDNIIVLPSKIIENIFHELLHMATTIKTEYEIYCGFDIISDLEQVIIGRHLNEGYTTLLTDRYFIKTSDYKLEKNFVLMLEKIIDKKEMEKSYFNANIIQLINEMMKYNTRDKSIEFIKNLDTLCYYVYELEFKNKKQKKELEMSVIELNTFLLESYINKLKILKEEYNLSNEDIMNRFKEYFNDLSKIKIGTKNNLYYFKKISLDKYQEYIMNNLIDTRKKL